MNSFTPPERLRAADFPFSWSLWREQCWEQCPRSCFFHYYAARGGHDPDAPERQRKLHLLKQLLFAEEYLLRLLTSELLRGDPETWQNRTLRRFAREWSAMLTGRYLVDHRQPVIFELYYKRGTPLQLFLRLEEALKTALPRLSATPELRLWGARPRIQQIREPDPVAITLAGVTLFAPPLFGWRAAGQARLRQLVRHRPDATGAAKLLLLHKYYALQQLRLPPERVSSTLLTLTGETIQLDPRELNLSLAIEQIQESIQQMQSCVAPDGTIGELDFPDRPEHCPKCAFRSACSSAARLNRRLST